MTAAQRTLGLVLATGPDADTDDLPTVVTLARAARRRGMEVRLFLLWDGVLHALGDALDPLVADGVEVTLCAQSAAARRVPARDDLPHGSQDDHAALVLHSDRVLTFT